MIRISDNTYALRPLRFDAGAQFGLAVFETILVTSRPLFWQEHCQRLNRGLRDLDIRPPLDPAWLLRQVRQLSLGDCVLKITASSDNLVFQTRNIPDDESYREYSLTAVPDPRPRDMRLLRNKTCAYLANLLAFRDAAAKGYADALLISGENIVAETTRANIFWIREGAIYTPSDECGLLPGITRQWLMANFPVKTGKYEYCHIMAADTVLAANSVMGIRPVISIDAQNFGLNSTGREIISVWRDLVPGL